MVDVSVAEAEDILEDGEDFVNSLTRDTGKVEELREKLDDLRYELEHETDNLGAATKDVKDLMEEIEEDAIHDEPEMVPEKEREAREEGPRDEEYGPNKP